MLGWRIGISAVLIPALVLIFWLDAHSGPSALWLLFLAEVLVIRSVWELADLFRDRSKRIQLPVMFVCAAGIVFSAWIPHLGGEDLTGIHLTPMALVFAVAVMLLCAAEAARFNKPGSSLETLGTEILIISYMALLLAVTCQLRWVAGAEAGYLVLGSLLVCAKGGDIGAYTLGRLIGKRKMAPKLSPGKTWAGAVGALLGAGLIGVLWFEFATPLFNPNWEPCAWWLSIIYGAIVGTVGLIGDLCESLLKRDAGKKDSAALFPGFGGLLDLLDSVIFAGPMALILWELLPLAPIIKPV